MTKYIIVVVPAPDHVRDKLQQESKRALDAPGLLIAGAGLSVIPDLIRDRNDGVNLFYCRVNNEVVFY